METCQSMYKKVMNNVRSSPPNEAQHPQNRAEPKTTSIIVIGLTGSGKSTLIKHLTGDDNVKIGDTLESESQSAELYRSKEPTSRFRFQYLDTPGFDDTNRIDLDVLEEITKAIRRLRRCKYSIAGVIYTHRIVDDRVTGSSLRCIKVLQNICGAENYGRIAMVATHWDKICKVPGSGVEVGKQRLEELRTKFLGNLEQPGGSFIPADNNVKSKIEKFFSRKCEDSSGTNICLSIERELSERSISLPFTGAGRVVIEGMDLRIKDIQNGIEFLQQVAAATPDEAVRQDVETKIRNMENQLYGINKKQTQIKGLLPPPAPAPPREDHSKHQAASTTGLTIDEIPEYILQYLYRQQSLLDEKSDRSTHQYNAGDIPQSAPPRNLSDQERIEIQNLLLLHNQFIDDVRSTMLKLGISEEVMTLEKLAEVFKHCKQFGGGMEH